jgi:hypothetical protein
MYTKVIIEQGKTKVVLTPENDFETDLIEKIHDRKEKYTLNATVDAKYGYNSYSNYRIEIDMFQNEK